MRSRLRVAADVPLLALRRPAWAPREGDRWIMVESLEAAAAALGEDPRRVFLTLGARSSRLSGSAPQHFYMVRSVEAPSPEELPPRVELITARGPFNVADERALLETHRIEVIVTKNSGGAGADAKIDAARALSLPVIMVARPDLPEAPSVETVADALALARTRSWLDQLRVTRRVDERLSFAPAMSFVALEPMMMSVACRRARRSAPARVVMSMRSSGRLTAWAKITGVDAGAVAGDERGSASPSCQGRAFETGL